MSLSCPFESRNQGNENKIQRKYSELPSCVIDINTIVWLYQRFVCLLNSNLMTRCIAENNYIACGHLNTDVYFLNTCKWFCLKPFRSVVRFMSESKMK